MQPVSKVSGLYILKAIDIWITRILKKKVRSWIHLKGVVIPLILEDVWVLEFYKLPGDSPSLRSKRSQFFLFCSLPLFTLVKDPLVFKMHYYSNPPPALLDTACVRRSSTCVFIKLCNSATVPIIPNTYTENFYMGPLFISIRLSAS
jgi:hypothetical protein